MIPGWIGLTLEYLSVGYDRWDKVYFIGTTLEEPVKIGKSKNVSKRRDTLQGANPNKLEIFASTAEGAIISEASLHERFDKHRIRGEWFEPADEVLEAIEYIKSGEKDMLASKIEQRPIDLDLMASIIYAYQKNARFKEHSRAWDEWHDSLTDKDIEEIAKLKRRMPL